jgi:hypothetical protein
MRKAILSLVSISILASLVSACAPSMQRFTELTPRLQPYALGEHQHVSSEPGTPLNTVNAK